MTRLGRVIAHPPFHWWTALSWVALLAGGMVVGWYVPSYGTYLIGLLGLAAAVLVSLYRPQEVLLFTMALFPIAGMIHVQFAGVVLRSNDLLLVPLIAAILVRTVLSRQRLRLSGAAWALAAYAVFTVISFAWAQRPTTAAKEGFQFLAFWLIFFVIDNIPWTLKRFHQAVVAYLVGCVILVIGGLSAVYAFPVLPYLRMAGGTAFYWSPGYYHVVLQATIAGFAVLLSMALLMGQRRTQGQKIVLGFVILLSILLIAVINKRVPTIGFGVALFVYFAMSDWRRGLLYSTAACLLVLAVATFSPEVRQHYADLTNPDARSTKAHLERFPQVGWRMFKERPLLGGGGGAFAYQAAGVINEYDLKEHEKAEKDRMQAHNLLIKTVADSGLIGLAILSIFIWLALRQVWLGCAPGAPSGRLGLYEHLCRGLFAALVLELFVSQGQNPHTFSFWWALLALGNHASQVRLDEPRQVRAANGRPAVPEGRPRVRPYVLPSRSARRLVRARPGRHGGPARGEAAP